MLWSGAGRRVRVRESAAAFLQLAPRASLLQQERLLLWAAEVTALASQKSCCFPSSAGSVFMSGAFFYKHLYHSQLSGIVFFLHPIIRMLRDLLLGCSLTKSKSGHDPALRIQQIKLPLIWESDNAHLFPCQKTLQSNDGRKIEYEVSLDPLRL